MKWEQVGRLELEQLYYEENLSDSLIAERFGISKNEVRKKRKLYNVSIQMHSIDNAFLEYSRLADTRFQKEISDLLSPEALYTLNQQAKERFIQFENIDALAKTSLDKGIQGKEAKKVLPTLHKTPPNGTIGGVFVCGGKSLNPGPRGYAAPIVIRRYLQAWQTKPRPTPRRKRRAALLHRSRRNRR